MISMEEACLVHLGGQEEADCLGHGCSVKQTDVGARGRIVRVGVEIRKLMERWS